MLRLSCLSGVLLAAGCATTPAPIPAGPSAADADAPEGQAYEASVALGDAPVWQPPTGPQEGVVFSCPHHPEVVSDAPGVCPKCHMDLLPREKEPGSTPGAGDPAEPGHAPHAASDAHGHDGPRADAGDRRPRAPAASGREAARPTSAANARVLYVCPHHPVVTSDAPGTCPKCGDMALVPQKAPAPDVTSGTTWVCPHHPEVTSDGPGTCSKCGGMALVPQKAAAPDATSATTWVCPHHPEVTSDAPGTCSKCGGMALVPMKKETQP